MDKIWYTTLVYVHKVLLSCILKTTKFQTEKNRLHQTCMKAMKCCEPHVLFEINDFSDR